MINFKRKSSTIFLILLSFNLGFLYRHSRPTYLIYFKSNVERQLQKVVNYKNKNSDKICPEKIFNLPKNSTLIIGHAYGYYKNSEARGNVGIAPKVYDFYLKNRNNINSIIFSGDVLKEPSLKKWRDFYAKFEGEVKIYIAPGNHDIGGKIFDSAQRDIFKIVPHKNQSGLSFPFKLILDKSLFIIGDSNSEKNSLDEIISIINREKEFKNIYVVMHHAFPEGLRKAANKAGKHNFIKDSYLKDKFKNNNKEIIFFYGDGGAYPHKPRYKCLKLANSYHLISGIGELKGDTIFVIHNQNLYRMEI